MEVEERSGLELGTGRLLALADGIFAIAMTLLVFEIKVPVGAADGAALRAMLMALWPKFASCGLGFLTLGYCWIGHHNQYAAIRRTDQVFLWINVAFLSSIALVPFSTALLGEYPAERTAILTYAGNLCLSGILLYFHWAYATAGHRLVGSEIDQAFVDRTRRRVLSAPIGYVVAMGLTFWQPLLGLAVCLALPIYFMIPGRVDRHWGQRPAGSL